MGRVGCAHVECDEEREAAERPPRDIPAITMSTVGLVGLCGLLLLCLGMLLGSTWTVQAMNRQSRRVATEWRELHAARLTMQKETRLCCSWCGNLIVSTARNSSGLGSKVSAPPPVDDPHPETSRAVGVLHR
jgi:hypothetical protein